MTFWQYVWATLLGTFAGFVFSIVLFYLTERLKRQRERSKILKGLRRELAFDLALLDSWLKGIEDARPQVAAGDRNIFLYLDYTRFLSIFIQQAVREGILYGILSDAELINLDKAMKSCNLVAEQGFSTKLDQWKNGQIDNKEMFKTLEFHKYLVTTSKKTLEGITKSTVTAR